MSTTINIATKDQEREALVKIKKIVESLGSQSYLATAFEGCFQDAEENIENDFACSMKGRYEAEHEKTAHAEAERDEANQKAELLSRKVDTMKAELNNSIDRQAELRAAAESLNHLLTEQRNTTDKETARADAAEAEVIRLKAKLYDLLVK